MQLEFAIRPLLQPLLDGGHLPDPQPELNELGVVIGHILPHLMARDVLELVSVQGTGEDVEHCEVSPGHLDTQERSSDKLFM